MSAHHPKPSRLQVGVSTHIDAPAAQAIWWSMAQLRMHHSEESRGVEDAWRVSALNVEHEGR